MQTVISTTLTVKQSLGLKTNLSVHAGSAIITFIFKKDSDWKYKSFSYNHVCFFVFLNIIQDSIQTTYDIVRISNIHKTKF